MRCLLACILHTDLDPKRNMVARTPFLGRVQDPSADDPAAPPEMLRDNDEVDSVTAASPVPRARVISVLLPVSMNGPEDVHSIETFTTCVLILRNRIIGCGECIQVDPCTLVV